MGFIDKIMDLVSKPKDVNGIPEECEVVFFGRKYRLHPKVVEYVSDNRSKALYDLTISSMARIEGKLREFISEHYAECIQYYCEGFTLPRDTDSTEYADIKLLSEEWNAQNMIDGGVFEPDARKGLDSLIRMLVPGAIYIDQEKVLFGVMANKYCSEGFQVVVSLSGIDVGYWE